MVERVKELGAESERLVFEFAHRNRKPALDTGVEIDLAGTVEGVRDDIPEAARRG